MKEYLIIEVIKGNNSLILNNTITDQHARYIGYTIQDAIKAYRKSQGLRYKHFNYIYL